MSSSFSGLSVGFSLVSHGFNLGFYFFLAHYNHKDWVHRWTMVWCFDIRYACKDYILVLRHAYPLLLACGSPQMPDNKDAIGFRGLSQ
jgi:hypothetical protein